jgi:hypothetical protein
MQRVTLTAGMKALVAFVTVSLSIWLLYDYLIKAIEARALQLGPTVISLTKVEQVKLMAFDFYYPRQSKIQKYCQQHMGLDDELTEVNTDPKWRQELWFDNQNHLLYCQISKVSSSTWVAHLLK